MQNEVWSIKKILEWSAKYLSEKNSETPRLDAELLLSNVLGLSRVSLYVNFDKPLTDTERDSYRKKLHRRSLGEPVAYILNSKEFFGLDFLVNKAVLIPRPDTEILVEAAISHLKKSPEIARILDLGTGSGCIVVALDLLSMCSRFQNEIPALRRKISAASTLIINNFAKYLFKCFKHGCQKYKQKSKVSIICRCGVLLLPIFVFPRKG